MAARTFAIIGAGAVAAALIAMFALSVNAPVSNPQPGPVPQWAEGEPMPTPRTEVAGAALDNKIYVIGGLDQRGSAVSTVEVYDPEVDRWNASTPLPQPLHHAAAASHNGTLYVVGGYLEDNEPSDMLL